MECANNISQKRQDKRGEEIYGWSTYLDENALERRSHGDRAEFHEEISSLETRPARFDLCLLLRLVKIGQFEHQQVEQVVGHQGHRLVAIGVRWANGSFQ